MEKNRLHTQNVSMKYSGSLFHNYQKTMLNGGSTRLSLVSGVHFLVINSAVLRFNEFTLQRERPYSLATGVRGNKVILDE